MVILLSIAVLAGFGLILGALLVYLSKVLYVEVDTRVEDINALLPGINCGGCGRPGCAAFAEALVEGNSADLSHCKPASVDAKSKIAEYLKQHADNIAK